MEKRKILIIEKRPIVRLGLCLIIKDAFDCEILEYNYLEQSTLTSDICGKLDVVILGNTDITLEIIINQLKSAQNEAAILVIAEKLEYTQAMNLLVEGTKGFVLQNCKAKEIKTSIEKLLRKQKHWCHELIEKMAQDAYMQAVERRRQIGKNFSDSSDTVLSKRQKEIAEYLIKGNSLSEIAQKLGIKVSTVATHKMILFRKLSVQTVLDLLDLYSK